VKKLFTLLLCLVVASGVSLSQTVLTPSAAPRWQSHRPEGYWASASSGLRLMLAFGQYNCSGTPVTYKGGTLSLTANATNYVYLDVANNCAPAVSTTNPAPSKVATTPATNVLLATVVTNATGVTDITDARFHFHRSNKPVSNK